MFIFYERGSTYMAKTYVAIYQNKELNYTIYFDFKENEIFLITEQINKPVILAMSSFSLIFYVTMKNISFDLVIDPLSILLITSVLGIVLGYLSIKLINKAVDKGLDQKKKVIHPTSQELLKYIYDGRKQTRILVFIIPILFFLVFLSSILLYFVPQSVVMFLATIGIWPASIVSAWIASPIKRSQAHKLLEGKIEEYSVEEK